MGKLSPADKVTIVTYPDEFSRREIADLARAAGYSVQAVITQKRVVKSNTAAAWGRPRSSSRLGQITDPTR